MFAQLFIDLRNYFEAGGNVLWAILIATIILWMLIFERYAYLFFVFPGRRRETVAAWEARSDTTSWYAKQIREQRLSELSIEAKQGIGVIKSLVGIIPLLGLLGTVTGMIQVFDVLASIGSTNARAMAQGVSAATIPTMSAMTVAVFSLYFTFSVEKRAKVALEQAEDEMRHF
ncbi:MAG: MotA/TolQ/ExbB proton channel family protein [Gammaproteobacteria bacterium]